MLGVSFGLVRSWARPDGQLWTATGACILALWRWRRLATRLRFLRLGCGAAYAALTGMGLESMWYPTCARTSPVGKDALHRRVKAELAVFSEWLARNGRKGYVGEVGWPNDAYGEVDRWNELAQA